MNRIRDLREDSNLSQKQMADILQIHQTTYSSYELGKLGVPTAIWIALAQYYGVSVDYLMGVTDIPTPYPRKKHRE